MWKWFWFWNRHSRNNHFPRSWHGWFLCLYRSVWFNWKVIKLSKKQWSEIESLASKIDPKSIDKLSAPSSENATDRALSASITINKNDVIYESSTFDHGNPPDELKPLISKLFELIYWIWES